MASLFLLFSLSLAFLSNCQADLISDVCSAATNPPLCNQTLTSAPGTPGADTKSLGQIAIEKAKNATQDAIRVVTSFNNTQNKDIVKACVETYNDAIDSLNKCSQSFKNSSYDDAWTEGSAVVTNVVDCDVEFGDIGEPVEVKEATQRVQDIIDIFLVIASRGDL